MSLPPGDRSAPAVEALDVGVSCRGVVKDFGSGDTRTRVLHGIDCDIGCGRLTLLVGPSGCGKTTLISIIAGLLDPTEGEIVLFGTPRSRLRGDGLVDFRARNVGFVFQQYNLLPALSAAENVAVPLLVNRVPRAEALGEARRALAAVGLEGRCDARPEHLSGGQQQRVAIARALVHRPRLLVCDEPTAALDSRSGHTVMELLTAVAVQPGRTVIVVTHDARVMEFGDRIIEMADGRIVRHDVVKTSGAGASP